MRRIEACACVVCKWGTQVVEDCWMKCWKQPNLTTVAACACVVWKLGYQIAEEPCMKCWKQPKLTTIAATRDIVVRQPINVLTSNFSQTVHGDLTANAINVECARHWHNCNGPNPACMSLHSKLQKQWARIHAPHCSSTLAEHKQTLAGYWDISWQRNRSACTHFPMTAVLATPVSSR